MSQQITGGAAKPRSLLEKLCTRCKSFPQASPSNPWCLACKSEAQNSYRKKCIDKGLCVDCGAAPHRPDRRTCQACEDRKRPTRLAHSKAFKRDAVDYLGATCADCGLKTEWLDVYDFHHRDPTVKDFNIGQARGKDWLVVKTELDKCDLLCANCHRIRHAKMGGKNHGAKKRSGRPHKQF